MSSPIEDHSWKKSLYNDFLSGGVAGITVVSLIQPLIYFKNQSQSKGKGSKPSFGFNPRVWYKGGLGFAASFAPTVALQNTVNGVFSSHVNSLAAAALAGAFSGIVVSPAELIMIQQQKDKLSFFRTARATWQQIGISVFTRGLFPTMLRESVFTGAYLGMTPYLKHRYMEMGFGEGRAHLIAAVVSGVVAAIISHPLDTYKTRLQKNFDYNEKFIKVLFSKDSFAGLGWRIAMVVVATTVLPNILEKLKE